MAAKAFDPAKLQAFIKKKQGESTTRTGGKGTVRRKHKAVRKATTHDDKRLKATLSKLNVRDIPAIEEVNLFHADGLVTHFASPKVQASITANTYVVTGTAETKQLQDLLPGIISQLGSDNLEDLKKIYASYQNSEANRAEEDDDDVPDLVENFEDVSKAGKESPAKATEDSAKPKTNSAGDKPSAESKPVAKATKDASAKAEPKDQPKDKGQSKPQSKGQPAKEDKEKDSKPAKGSKGADKADKEKAEKAKAAAAAAAAAAKKKL